ncbi:MULTISPECIES: hypothetical protein [unclassified Bradyrhizobium]|uniref:hypothetical protein n=1 Tax=unclassified Bradyrhizobium TaxID=2631580 RepID=UPI0003F8CFD4|nr:MULTISPECIES: hypothetical protein [unclassified Bradyrhizobium]MCP3464422.1 hypothetical protein [Bradyrhizobium sp. CCGUVB23]
MKWFARRKPSDVWDEPIQWPIGDIEAADRIRNICQSASASAELVGGSADHGRKSLEKQRKLESERYERAARAAMEIAMKISDDLMRDDAVRRIVDLCMKAGDIKTAQILYRAIQASWVREATQKDYPALGQ